jgi:uncharacterized protein (TIGR03086 family)
MPASAESSDTTEVTGTEDSASAADRRVAELIALGRDREAAELAGVAAARRGAGRDDDLTIRGGTMDALARLDELGPLLGGVVGNIRPDQLDNPTPCTEFTVRDVLEHMVGGATMFTAAFGGTAPSVDPGDPLGAFGPTLSALGAAMHEPGALDRTIDGPSGAVPGHEFAQFVVLDGLVHGWDLATATGQRYEPSDALVADAATFASGAIEPMRDGRTFAPPTEPPASAAPIERLAAFTGRRV